MKLLLYCTKAKRYLTRNDLPNEKGEFYKHWQLGGELDKKHLYGDTPILNAKIVAECDFEVEEITFAPNPSEFERANFSAKEWGYDYQEKYGGLSNEELLKHSCLTNNELSDYLNTPINDKKTFCKDTFGYAIHIKNLHIFDKPRDIRNYYNIATRTMADCMNQKNLRKPPQNMCNAYDVYKNHYILISIKPEWLCKILNGEKTIEVRRSVLKEMK